MKTQVVINENKTNVEQNEDKSEPLPESVNNVKPVIPTIIETKTILIQNDYYPCAKS